ncbi:hypothetical protein SDC9_170665 [bioreactor metagenome]|uniref:Uncharacterized protein n=1 Tax=bioreactor metagenome TaxID=1076179 RepID=A0A645G8Q2_9ZZZZ
MVLGQPVAFEAKLLHMAGGAHGDGQGVGHGATFTDGNQVEHGEGGAGCSAHAHIVEAPKKNHIEQGKCIAHAGRVNAM